MNFRDIFNTSVKKVNSINLTKTMVSAIMVLILLTPQLLKAASNETIIDLNDPSNATYSFTNWSFNSVTNTYTVSNNVAVTGSGSNSSMTRTLTFVISGVATVQWNVQLYRGAANFAGPLITLQGDGTFETMPNTWLQHTGNGNTINSTGNSAIKVNGTVLSATGTTITSDGTNASVTVQGSGSIVGEQTTNLRPLINMTNIANTGNNVFVKDNGHVWHINEEANYGYCIQTYGNIVIDGGNIYSSAINGRSINLVGPNSLVTLNAGIVWADGVNGVAISSATTAGVDVVNASVIINGGTVMVTSGMAIRTTGANSNITVNGGSVSATTGDAINTTGANSTVNVTGGQVSSLTGTAIRTPVTNSTVTISGGQVWVMKATNAIRTKYATLTGGFVFAFGTNASSVISATSTVPYGSSVLVVAWNQAAGVTLYPQGSSTSFNPDLQNSLNGQSSHYFWHNHPELGGGINYNYPPNTGFFKLPVSIVRDYGLIFDSTSGLMYANVSGSGIPGGVNYLLYPSTPETPEWVGTTGSLTLNNFSWNTSAQTALTFYGGGATITLNGTSSFTSNYVQSGNSFGVSSTYPIVINGSGSIIATGGNPSSGNSYGMNINNLTINSGTVESKGATSSFGYAPTALPTAYTYWTNTTVTDPGGSGTICYTGTPPYGAPYQYNASQKFVKITSNPFAIIDNVTVSGTVGVELNNPPAAIITLYGITINSTGITNDIVNSWFTSLPNGISVKAIATPGSNTITLNFEGTPTVTSNESFRITIPANLLNGGADMTVIFNVNARFNIGLASPSLTLAASPPNIQIYPGNVTLTATLSGAYPYNYGKDIIFSVNSVIEYYTVTNAIGVATIVLNSPVPGNYNFIARFAGDANNNSSSDNINNYIVENANPEAEIDDITVIGTVGITLTTPQTTKITLHYLETVDGDLINENVNSWFANLPVGLNVWANATDGDNEIFLEFDGIPEKTSNEAFVIIIPSSVYSGATDIAVLYNPNAKFQIGRASPTLTLTASPAGTQTYPGDVTLTATLTGTYPNNVDKIIIFSVNGHNYEAITNGSGVATLIPPSLLPGNYTFEALFEADLYNNSASSNIVSYTVTAPDPSAEVLDVIINGTVGTTLTSEQVATIILHDDTVETEGIRSYSDTWFVYLPNGLRVWANAEEGSDEITLEFEGAPTVTSQDVFNINIPGSVLSRKMAIHVDDNINAKFNIVRASPSILVFMAIPPNTQTYPGNVTIMARLINAYPSSVGQVIKFNISGTEYIATTDETGYATIVLNSPVAGNYTFNASFTEDAFNNGAVSSTINYTVVPVVNVEDVIIEGIVGTELTPQSATIILNGDEVVAGGFSGSANAWFTNLPNGLSVTATAIAATNVITLNFTGTSTVTSNEAFVINIPASVIASNIAVSVQSNANAKFGIYYLITASASPAAGGSVSDDGYYLHGDPAVVTAIANSNYNFINWTENNVEESTNPSYNFTAVSNRTLVANFELKSYIVTLLKNPNEGGDVTGAGTYQHGESAEIKATANDGYDFLYWTTTGGDQITANPYTFIVTADITLTANFGVHNLYMISVSANPSEGGTVSGGGNYDLGELITVSASPKPNYVFINWTENGAEVSTDANYQFTVEGSRILVANFTLITYTITASVVSGIGTIEPLGITNISHGGSQSYIITADDNYQIQSVLVDGEEVFNPTPILPHREGDGSVSFTPSNEGGRGEAISPSPTLPQREGAGNASFTPSMGGGRGEAFSYTFSNVIANHTIEAFFTPKAYLITVVANPIAGGSVEVNGSGTSATAEHGDPVTVEADANPNFTFVNWQEAGGAVMDDDPSGTYTFLASKDIDLIANFQEAGKYFLTLEVIPANAGTVLGTGSYFALEYVSIEAIADNDNYEFVAWMDGATELSTDEFFIYQMPAENKTLTALFQGVEKLITVTVEPSGSGTVTGEGTYRYGETATLTASANDNYTFVNWVEGSTVFSTNPTYSFTVTGDRDMIANFATDTYLITVLANPLSGGTVTGGGNYIHDASVTIEAFANADFEFINWTKEGVEVTKNTTFNFNATESATYTANFKLTLGKNTDLDDIDVDGGTPDLDNTSGSTFAWIAPCDSNEVLVTVTANDPNATVEIKVGDNYVAQNPLMVNLPNYGINRFTIKIIAANGVDYEEYTLTIFKMIPFWKIVVMRWNNTLSIINNPANNGGFTFVTFRWFRDGQQFNTDQWWSAGADGEPINTEYEYYVEVVTTDGMMIRTCPAYITLRSMEVKVAPNPVSFGQIINIEANIDDELIKDAVIEVYDAVGNYIESLKVQGRFTPVDIRYASGLYVFVLKSAEGFTKEVKVTVY